MPDVIASIIKAAENHPQNIAISSGSEEMTYRELLSTIQNVAKNAVSFGMLPGEKFLFGAKPTPTTMAYALGLIHAGLTLAFVDPLTSNELFKGRVSKVHPEYTLASPFLYLLGKPMTSAILRKTKGINVADFSKGASTNLTLGRKNILSSHISVKGWNQETAAEVPVLSPQRPIVIVFTSGTTSEPKGVVHTAESLASNMSAFADKFEITPGKLVFAEPMTLGITALSRGAQWRIPQKGEKLPNCDIYFAVPTELLAQLQEVEKSPVEERPKVTTVGTGAAPVLPSLLNRIYSVLGDETLVYGVYGMTEILPIAVIEGREKLSYTGKGDIVGQPIGRTKARLASDQEVVISGDGLMRGYLGQPDITELPTGDSGIILPDGTLVLTGRKKEMFIRGNMNIYPGLYEPQLSLIKGVEQAVMVGLEDEYGDDFIALAVTIKAGHKEVEVIARVQKEMKLVTDGDAVPDIVVPLDAFPTSGRALKLDRSTLKTIVQGKLANNG